MRDRDFYLVWMDAIKWEKVAFMAKWESPAAWGGPEDISADAEIPTAAGLENIWSAAHMGVKYICKEAGLTQRQSAPRFCIPAPSKIGVGASANGPAIPV